MVHSFREYLTDLSPFIKRLVMIALDVVLIPLSLWLSLSLRYGELFTRFHETALVFAGLTIFTIPVFVKLGLYRAIMRYVGWLAFEQIAFGILLSSGILLAIILMSGVALPRSAFILYGLVALVTIGGSRLVVRRFLSGTWLAKKGKAVAIYGAGGSGRQLVSSLRAGPDFKPVAFLDDNPRLHRRQVEGIDVLNPSDPQLVEKLQSRGVKKIFLSIPSATYKQRRRILERLESFPCHVLTVPGLQEIVSGKARLEQLREIQLEDLLGREPVPPNPRLMDQCIRDQSVLVTGAAGSIGSELCRQIIGRGARELILLDHSEYGLYQLEAELQERIVNEQPELTLVPLLGSVTDAIRLEAVFSTYKVDTVYHAAAYKHVPLVEHNPLEGLNTNTFGTWRTADCARRHGVKNFVLISTDKAVRPTNVMGASKRMAEMILQAMQQEPGNTVFSMVRFGNVLGSSGSVVPLFRQQIESGGPVTVTHRDVKRYFMTIPEAVQLVIQAGAMAKGGDVFVLDMGDAVSIFDLAKHMIRLSGLEVCDAQNPDGDIEIIFSGLRSGEKLFEELLIGNDVSGTEHPKIMRAVEEMLPMSELEAQLNNIQSLMKTTADVVKIRGLIAGLVSGYSPTVPGDEAWKKANVQPEQDIILH